MTTERIEQIRSLLEKAPEDVFLHYSLAMELATADRCDEAAVEFRACMELDERYLPAYVEAGKVLRSAGELDQAREVFQAGLKLASETGDDHVRSFIAQQLEALPADKS